MAIDLNLTAGIITPGLEQIFQTTPLPNFRQALYALSIRAHAPASANILTYTFPLSPTSVSKSFNAMTNIYDVQGSAQTYGVNRIADQYGDSPPSWILEGTTGWQYHATDGGAFTGLDSIIAIQNLLNQFAKYQVSQSLINQPPYSLEFYDYFSGDFWQVVPMGQQGIRQSAVRPLLFEYSFHFAGIRDLSQPQPPTSVDVVAQTLSVSATQAQSNLSSVVGSSLTAYKSLTNIQP
ncbi:MAG: hypothetical protein KGJ90_04595 [Patescibacteria group bacterium]|nr:hypothetical protein [Patescibacteria group bacterium]